MTNLLYDPLEQFEKEINAVCRGVFKSIYKNVSTNYVKRYPHFEFLKQLPIESLQYLNRITENTKHWTKNQHVFWFISHFIENLRIQITEPTLENQYIRCMMKNDANYYYHLALEEDDLYTIDERYDKERNNIVEQYFS